jgi:hypothetical protein
VGAALGPLAHGDLRDWTPAHVTARGEPQIEWAVLADPFTEPFFEHTAERAMLRPFNALFARRTPLAALDELPADPSDLVPAGFVFHMSRSGSTLIAQMLAQLSSAIVLSEAQPLDALIRLHRRAPEAQRETLVRRLRAMVRALGRARRGERHLFVKFHAWHVLELPLIAQAFPQVPWAFAFREPRAVLRSQARQPGAEFVATTIDPAYLGIRSVAELAAPDYGARVLAAFCEAALRHASSGRCAFVGYDELPDAVPERIASFFGVTPSAADAQRMREAARRDAKAPARAFRAAAPAPDAGIEQLAARWLDAPYAALRAAAMRPVA